MATADKKISNKEKLMVLKELFKELMSPLAEIGEDEFSEKDKLRIEAVFCAMHAKLNVDCKSIVNVIIAREHSYGNKLNENVIDDKFFEEFKKYSGQIR